MAAQFVTHYFQDLQQDIKIRQCGTIVFNADNLSNVIEIELYNGTEAYSGGGSVSCSVIAPDGATVPVTGGTLSGNVVSVTLTGDCFAIPGQIGVGVQVVNGTQKTTVLKAIYNVELLDTDTVVDPGSRLTASVADLVSDIETATAEIPASDMASLMAGIAPTFSTSISYQAGAYVYYSGTLYRFTAAHSAGSWTGTDAIVAVVGNDVSDLKTATETAIEQQIGVEILHANGTSTFSPAKEYYINANISNGVIGTSNPARATTPYIYIPINTVANWTVASGYAFTAVAQYDANKTYLGQFTTQQAATRFIRCCLKRSDNENITLAEAAAAFSVSFYYAFDKNVDIVALEQQTTAVEILHANGTNTFSPAKENYINANMSSGIVGAYNAARATTPFIYIPVNASISWSLSSGYTFTSIYQYDAEKNVLGQYVDVKPAARFIRFCIKRSDDADITLTEAAEAFSVSYTYSSNYVTKEHGKNLLDTSTTTVGYIKNNTGAIDSTNTYRTSDYIPISNGQKITISPSVRIFLAYDENQDSITSSYMNTETDNYTYTASANGYIRFSYRVANESSTQAEYGDTATDYEPYRPQIEAGIGLNITMKNEVNAIVGGDSAITGKKFLLFGDSIMHGAGNSNYGIGDILNELYNMTFWDYCESGALVEYKSGVTATPVYQQVLNAISANRDPDFVIIDGLSNDITSGMLGTVSGDFDYSTHGYNDFSSALEYCFGLLRTNYPTVPVLYVIPHSSAARVYATELQFGDRAREICKKWSVPIADVYKDGNMTARISAQLQEYTYYPTETSGTHPNRKGYDFAYMPLIVNWLKNIYANIVVSN